MVIAWGWDQPEIEVSIDLWKDLNFTLDFSPQPLEIHFA